MPDFSEKSVNGWRAELGGDGLLAGVFNGISIDWEFPCTPSLENTYHKEDGVRMKNLFMEFKK